MSDPRLDLAKPLLQELTLVYHNVFCGKALMYLSIIIGLGFSIFLSLVNIINKRTHGAGKQHLKSSILMDQAAPIPPGWTELPAFKELSVPVKLFRSDSSGLRVCLVRTEGPLVELHAVLATEACTNEYAHRDDGLPHTLEHLVFLGSELYPFKGVLDKLANRCLAKGTNAYTDVDHTAYSIKTVGSEGFLSLLPIYMDHIMFATLTNEGFVTEIHHITEEGEDKGVVYCEMQGRENTGPSLIDRACLDLLYPDPKCGYNAETGGKMAQLRTLRNAKIQRYHREYYRPDNCLLLVTGVVDAGALLTALASNEAKFKEKPKPSLPRPWLHPVDSGWHGGKTEVSFPSEDESTGFVSLCWRGPKYSDFETKVARQLLWLYLSESSASPLQKGLVECEDALCGELNQVAEVFSVGYEQVWFEACATETIADVVPRVEQILIEEHEKGIEMERMRDVINRHRRVYLSAMEDSPQEELLRPIIKHFLYADRNGTLGQEVEALRTGTDRLRTLKAIEDTYTESAWQTLLQSALIDAPKAIVIAHPSAEKAKQMSDDEKNRTQEQAKMLGKAKLAELGEVLKNAVATNEKEAPDSLLSSLPIPNVSKVASVSVTIAFQDKPDAALRVDGEASEQLQSHLDASRSAVAASALIKNTYVQWVHVDSVFVRVEAALDTTILPAALRPALPLLMESFFKLGVKNEDGSVTPAAEIIEALQRDTVDFGSEVGQGSGNNFMPGVFGGCAFVSVKTEANEFNKAVEWLRKILYQTVLDPVILKVQANKLLSEIPDHKRDGGTMAGFLMAEALFGHAPTNHGAMNIIRQKSYLEKFVDALESGGEAASAVVADLEECRKLITSASSIRVHVATDLLKVAEPYQTLSALFPADVTEHGSLTDVALLRSSAHVRHSSSHQVLGLASVENSWLQQSTSGLLAHDPELPALLVAIEYLTALEGDFWCRIRGLGLAYGYTLRNKPESRVLQFGLHRTTDPVEAQRVACEIVAEYCRGDKELSDITLDASKSSLIYDLVEVADTKAAATAQAWSHVFAGKPIDYEKQLMTKVLAVRKEEVIAVMRKHIMAVFNLSKASLVVVTPTSKVEAVAMTFNASRLQEDNLVAAFPDLHL